MKTLALCAAVALAGVSLAAQQTRTVPQTEAEITRVTRGEFEPLYSRHEVLVVDVRDVVAFESGRIPGSVHAPVAEITRRAASLRKLAGSRLIVTYCSCAAEHTSAEAALLLVRAGVLHVAALVGGYPEWVHAGGQTESGRSPR
ncbi:MAG: rhodanese-like domain-containing protein [Vicinamibacterales bacterium]